MSDLGKKLILNAFLVQTPSHLSAGSFRAPRDKGRDYKTSTTGSNSCRSWKEPSSSTVDHLSNGRVAWNIVTSYLDSAARNFRLDTQVEQDEHYRIADEYLNVVYKLWEGHGERTPLSMMARSTRVPMRSARSTTRASTLLFRGLIYASLLRSELPSCSKLGVLLPAPSLPLATRRPFSFPARLQNWCAKRLTAFAGRPLRLNVTPKMSKSP